MKLMQRLRAVEAAERRAAVAHEAWHRARAACGARAWRHPWLWLGAAAGFGVALGGLRVRPWRIRGLRALLGSGVVEGVAVALRLLGELGADGWGAKPRRSGAEGPAADAAESPGS